MKRKIYKITVKENVATVLRRDKEIGVVTMAIDIRDKGEFVVTGKMPKYIIHECKMKLRMSYVNIDPALKRILEESKDPISKRILEKKFTKGDVNFLGIANDDSSKLSYLNFSKMKALNPKFEFKKGDKVIINNSATEVGVTSTLIGTTQTLIRVEREWKKQSYAIRDNDGWGYRAIDVSNVNYYNPDKRFMGRVGKVVQKFLGEQLDGKELSKFVELFYRNHPSTSLQERYECKMVSGEEIRKWYHEENYKSDSGQLGSSCMRGEECQVYFDIYCENDKVKMFIVLDDDKLVARSLVWDDTYFDRIYASDDFIKESCSKELELRGLTDAYNGNEEITIEMESEFNYYPYMDTFMYVGDGKVSTEYFSGSVEQQNTEGGVDNCQCDECDECGDFVDEDYVRQDYHGNSYCSDCASWSDYHETYIRNNNAQWCENEGTYYYDNEVVELRDGNYAYQENVTQLWNGDYTYEDDDYVELYDGGYAQDKEVVCLHTGEYALENDEDVVNTLCGEYALKDDVEYSDYNNAYILTDDAHQHDGDYYTKEQYDEIQEEAERELVNAE